VFCDARRIWSNLLLLGLWERLPNLVPSLCTRAGPLQVIYGATMQPRRVEHSVRRYHLTVHEPSIAAPRRFQQTARSDAGPDKSSLSIGIGMACRIFVCQGAITAACRSPLREKWREMG